LSCHLFRFKENKFNKNNLSYRGKTVDVFLALFLNYPVAESHSKLAEGVMKTTLIVIGLIALSLVGSGSAMVQNKVYSPETWKLFCTQLAANLEHSNPGVRVSTMQHIVHYSMFPEFNLCDKGVKKLIAIVGNSKESPKVRTLALSALYNIGSARGMEFIEKQIALEKDPRIQHMCSVALYKYRQEREKLELGETLIADLQK